MNPPLDARGRALDAFERELGRAASMLLRGPGRVNIIGEHTDYNDGFVLPAAIDRELWIAAEPTDDDAVHASAEDFDTAVHVPLDTFDDQLDGWGRYVQGVAWALHQADLGLSGWHGTVASDVPVGAGLSSSAALELACARAFQAVSGWPWDPVAVARACRRAENDWVGVSSGLMDQLASAAGQQGAALLLDCRNATFEAVPVPETLALVVLDTTTRRELTSSGYNDRRVECQQAAEALGLDSLRDATVEMLDAERGRLDEIPWRRAWHVVTENDRTVAAADALRAGDLGRVGRLMYDSHRSLRDDFAVSSAALDAIVDATAGVEGCYGARLTGGGFAGCAIAAVAADCVPAFTDEVRRRYRSRTGLDAQVFACRPVDGASVERPVPATRGGE